MTSRLAQLLEAREHATFACVRFCLLWVASADGTVDQAEREIISQALSTDADDSETSSMISIIRQRDQSSFRWACMVVRDGLTAEGKRLLMNLIIGVAVADRRLSISENHICRFFADLLSIAPAEFMNIYWDAVGGHIPDPGDPSSIAWWKEQSKRQRQSEKEDRSERPSNSTGNMSKTEAYVVLGLRAGASNDEVRKAYRRLAQAHHPDRFEELGPEATKAAEVMFVRIRSAYEVLSK